MNPSNNETGIQLPPPVVEQQAVAGSAPAETAPVAPEQAPGVAERTQAANNAAGVAMPAFSLPAVTPPATQDSTSVQSASASGLPAADDGDLIEKEWVNKAKQIVERTRDDPYKQSEELTLVKVDYMKKRYGKTLKLK